MASPDLVRFHSWCSRPPRRLRRFWVGHGFSRAVPIKMRALQIAEKLKLRIRASLQRCRKFFELRRPFRGCAPKTGFFSNLFSPGGTADGAAYTNCENATHTSAFIETGWRRRN